uniref:Uncharacterized protein n=1 Tax=Arion vulgaris TaxID=1028688 RepID=A0A0B7A837_9EUPU
MLRTAYTKELHMSIIFRVCYNFRMDNPKHAYNKAIGMVIVKVFPFPPMLPLSLPPSPVRLPPPVPPLPGVKPP